MASLTQGGALPDITTQQTQTTSAPSWYTDYLQNIAKTGADAAANAQFVGVQPMQQQSYDMAKANVGNYQPTLNMATGALQSGINATSPLAAGNPYLTSAANPTYNTVGNYMSPYIQSVVGQIGDLAQQNMIQNVAPQTTAGVVGSGQFGSKRGAQVLGQTMADYGQKTTGLQLNALNTGYQQAMQQAQEQARLQGQLGQTAGQLASSGQQNLINAGTVGGNLATTTQNLGLADVNAINTLGTQQQQIEQARQLFPLQMAQAQAGLMQGINVPTTVESTYRGPVPGAYANSPLSTIGAGISGIGALSQTPFGKAIGSGLGNLFNSGVNIDSPNYLASIGATSDGPYATGSDLWSSLDTTPDMGVDWSMFGN